VCPILLAHTLGTGKALLETLVLGIPFMNWKTLMFLEQSHGAIDQVYTPWLHRPEISSSDQNFFSLLFLNDKGKHDEGNPFLAEVRHCACIAEKAIRVRHRERLLRRVLDDWMATT